MGISSLVGAGISGAASIFGASQQASASKKAAQLQLQAAQLAAQTQLTMFGQTQANERPYLDLGNQGAAELGNRLTDLTTPIDFHTPTAAEAQATPGYQFTLNNGLKGAQNGFAARGLGLSGAAIKGASTYASGLADSTYGDVFNRAQQEWTDKTTNQNNAYNKLAGVAGIGASAATGQGQLAAYTGSSVASNLISGGNAQAAGINGAAAATTSGINGLSNALTGGLSSYNSNALVQAIAKSKDIDLSSFGLGNALKGLYG